MFELCSPAPHVCTSRDAYLTGEEAEVERGSSMVQPWWPKSGFRSEVSRFLFWCFFCVVQVVAMKAAGTC